MSSCDTMSLWGVIKCVTWTNREKHMFCGCNFATNHFWDSAHMEKLECIIVYRFMPLVSSLASLSLATPTTCTILVMFVTASSGITMRGDPIYVFHTFFGLDLVEREKDEKGQFLPALEPCLFIVDISHLRGCIAFTALYSKQALYWEEVIIFWSSILIRDSFSMTS